MGTQPLDNPLLRVLSLDEYRTMCLSLSIGFMFALLIIASFHCITTLRQRGHKHASIFQSFALIALGVVQACVILSELILPFHICTVAQHLGPTTYALFKMTLYYIVISRLWSVFASGPLAYDARKLKAWLAIILGCNALNVVWLNLTVRVEWTPASVPECQPVIELPVVATALLIDVVSGIISTALFVRPLRKLYSLTLDAELKATMIKQCVLSILAITSTILALGIIAVLNFYILAVAFDVTTSTLSVILTFRWNSWLTNKLLWCCLPRALRMPKSVQTDIRNIEIIIR